MSIPPHVQAVLAEILDPREDLDEASPPYEPARPDLAVLVDFAHLLSREHSEKDLQDFLVRAPGFLTSFVPPASGRVLSFLVQPPIGTQYRADFALLTAGQGGASIWLFEIEPSDTTLFTKELIEADGLRRGLKQIRDWRQWIESNWPTFVRDMLRLSQQAPLYPAVSPLGSFRLLESAADVKQLWIGYGGDVSMMQYTLIVGRWSKLEPHERERFLFLNRESRGNWSMVTYDQVARIAYHRPDRYEELSGYFPI